MRIATHALGFTAHNQAELGVDLQTGKAVDDIDACTFKLFGPVDVLLFVKARLEFDHDRHLLAARTTGESLPQRYSVCLMATTSGSMAA